jgi:hypothetical protein
MKRIFAIVLSFALLAPLQATITVTGPTGPGGLEPQADLPVSQRLKNTGGMGPRGPGSGAGLCVFTSITHAARYQNERALFDFQSKMTHEPGGGYPEKVDAMIAKYAPSVSPRVLQYEGSDPTIMQKALESGRMVCCTYDGHDPHYGGTIAHMVNLIFLNADTACILDNNFIGDGELVWMTRAEFLQRWLGNGGGWCVILTGPAPAPVPKPKQ